MLTGFVDDYMFDELFMRTNEESDDLDDSTKTLLELPQNKTMISGGCDDLMRDLLEATRECVNKPCGMDVESKKVVDQILPIDNRNHKISLLPHGYGSAGNNGRGKCVCSAGIIQNEVLVGIECDRRSIFLDSNELLRNVIENLDASKKKDSFYKLSKQSCVVSPAYYDFYSSYVTEFLGHWKKIQKVIDYDNHIDHEWVIDAREKELMKLKSLEKAKATELKAIMIVVVKQSKFSPIFQQFRLSTAKLVAVVTFLKKRLLGYAVIEERNLIVGVRIECAFISKLEDMFIVIITFLDTMHELLNGMWILKCTTMSYKADNRRLFLCGTNRNGESFITEWNESGGDAKRTYQGLCKNSSTIVVLSSSLAEDEYDSTLMLKDCIKLTKFDQSIGELKMLTFLNLKDCKSLRKLPRTIGSLISLEELILSGCSRLYEVPRDLQNMNSFKVLNLDEIAIYQTRLQLPWLLSKRSKKMGFSLCLAL
ncbi:hypothetical protein V6N11_018926 [Hibiscus sabdariffa]|uniref:Uncharacterized protein n=1 Tax=Hibiscus sabdariffa TaxID=183260 RepID=A0ABR2R140_9ROSI